jgi:hypothetical protein
LAWLLIFKNSFLHVFENGGFDVVVGNPPYIKEDKHIEIFEPLNSANKKYKATKKSPAQNKPPFASQYYQGKMDFWQFFACLGLDLLNDDGYLSYIAPSSWITNHGASKTRKGSRLLSLWFEIDNYLSFFDPFHGFVAFLNQNFILISKTTRPRVGVAIAPCPVIC